MKMLRSKRALGAVAALLVIGGAGIAMNARTASVPNVTTAEVTRGDFIDYIQIRGDKLEEHVVGLLELEGDRRLVDLLDLALLATDRHEGGRAKRDQAGITEQQVEPDAGEAHDHGRDDD